MEFSILKGKILKDIVIKNRDTELSDGNEEIIFITDNDERYILTYFQDCCASCYIEDICGDLGDLIGNPILVAEEVISHDDSYDGAKKQYEHDYSHTFTFYKLDTIKGGVTIRWYGSSNGFYSESVSFFRYDPETDGMIM